MQFIDWKKTDAVLSKKGTKKREKLRNFFQRQSSKLFCVVFQGNGRN